MPITGIPTNPGSTPDDPTWLASSADAAAALGAAFAARADLPLLLGAASRAVEDHCHRAFHLASGIVEAIDGTGGPRLFLARTPVVAVSAVTINGVALDNTAGGEWALGPEEGELVRLGPGAPAGWPGRWDAYLGPGGLPGQLAWSAGAPVLGCWWPGTRNILVTYDGGHATIPLPVRQATLVVAKYLADATRNPGVYTLERIGDYEYQMAQVKSGEFPFLADMLLAPYRMVRAH